MKIQQFFIKILFVAGLLSAPLAASAVELPDPLKNLLGGDADVTKVVFIALAGFAAVFAVFAFGFLVINAFKLIISRGSEESITHAKEGIWWSIWGFVVAILSFSLVSAVHTFLGGTGANELANANALTPPISETGFLGVFKVAVNSVLGLTALAAAFMITYSGLRMVLSAGNEQAVETSKTILRWSIVGLIIIMLSYAILNGVNLVLMNGTA